MHKYNGRCIKPLNYGREIRNLLMDALMLTSYIGLPPSVSCFLPLVCTSFISPQGQIINKTLANPCRVSRTIRFKSRRDEHCLQRICFDSSFRSTILRPSLHDCTPPIENSMTILCSMDETQL